MGRANVRGALAGALLLQWSGTVAAHSAPYVALLTTMGSFVVELDPEHAPVTVANFLRYVNEKHFEDTLFYRMVPGFVIQGGNLATRETMTVALAQRGHRTTAAAAPMSARSRPAPAIAAGCHGSPSVS